ncbi:nuclear polyadenylated RNA-binding protein 3 [Exophiala xenobiotica]|uniref:Nuclear polyadenylated RNA-binding protein 3 n=1 Tax=Lithohypha guttulata TaxID=1690604 RepID=A0ABR0KA46_9EURO|nr:nuclear polyadenylated RNA-binding protein 3 [Lithohypha guttulata]KAK5326863.1 nuclear polyadenylated RNA-binding protein 3 [Exophiala xenobiotica]
MSNTSPPVEQQRFARTQTPESPRPVHVPEPANIPVLLNQMDQASNDLATYNIPTDQNFAHYGDSLENPAYKTSPTNLKDEIDPFRDFLRNADSVVANPPEPTVPEYTNQAGQVQLNGQVESDHANAHGTGSQLANDAQSFNTNNAQAIKVENGEEAGAQENTWESNEEVQLAGKEEQPTEGDLKMADGPTEVKLESGVDYQSLLDTITQSTSTAPAAEAITSITTDTSVPGSQTTSLPPFPGLPKKPPPLDTQNAFSAYVEHAQAQQQPIPASNQDLLSSQAAANGYAAHTNANSTDHAQTSHTVPANPFDTGLTNEQAIALHMQYSQQGTQQRQPTPPSRVATEPLDRPWSPHTQAVYDGFLESERRYVTEGIWDRFPLGSRLFVGNLPSEKVTKRDLFHRFHRFGRLAQISIKQAYGFVQYHDAESCKAALDAEQGVEIRGRKVHLEVSKPQKGSKASQQQQPKNQNQNQNQTQNKNRDRRRSRSPQRRSYSDFRDEPSRRREEFRDRRSPSPPRSRRSERVGSRDDRRSPMYGSNFSTPQPAAYDDEASLPYPRRDPRYVPDVQIVVLDGGVSQAFVNWIEDGLKRKGLQVATTWLNQRTPVAAVVKRQIVEGVQAVVKLASHHQARSKIPLQVFDRSHGTSNVTFNEYVDLDVPVAADVVLQARQRERGSTQPPRPHFPPAFPPPQSPYQQQSPHTPWQPPQQGMPYPPPQHQPPTPQHYQYSPQPPQPPQPPYLAPNTATGQPSNLQELLANLKGGAHAPPTPQSAHSTGLPHTSYGQPQPPPQYPQYSPHPQQQQPQYGAYGQQPYQQLPPQHNGNGGGQQQNVQYLLDQMSRNR